MSPHTREDAGVVLRQLVVPRARLQALQVRLRGWLAAWEPFSLGLCEGPGAGVLLSLGPCDDSLSSRYKPVFELEYDAGSALRTAWDYVVDPSCVDLFLAELTVALTGPS